MSVMVSGEIEYHGELPSIGIWILVAMNSHSLGANDPDAPSDLYLPATLSRNMPGGNSLGPWHQKTGYV